MVKARPFQTGSGILAMVLLMSGASAAQEARLPRTLGAPASRATESPAANWNAMLRQGGAWPNHERLLVVDADGRLLESVDGDASRVLLPDALFTRLCDERLRATLVHNHPDSVSLSGSDLIQLAKAGVDRVVAVGHDGTVYEATAAPAFEAGATVLRDYESVAEHVVAGILKEGRRGLMDPVAFSPHATHVIARVLAELNVITYEVRPSLTLRLTLDRHRASIDRLVDAEVRRVRAEWATRAATAARVTASR